MLFLLNLNNKPLYYSILIYLLSLIIFNILKPELSFTKNGYSKNFGIGSKETLFPFPIQSLIISIFIYLILNIYY